MKKVVICASESMYQETEKWKKILEDKGYIVIKTIQKSITSYQEIHTEHYKKIVESDILFILNLEKNKIKNYIGPSVFAEIAFTIGLNISLGKKIEIYSLNPLPENLPYSHELKLWEKLGWIKLWGVLINTSQLRISYEKQYISFLISSSK